MSMLSLPAMVLQVLAVATLWNNRKELVEQNSNLPDRPRRLPHFRPEVYVKRHIIILLLQCKCDYTECTTVKFLTRPLMLGSHLDLQARVLALSELGSVATR
jgi:hypothetical protein